MDSVELRQVRRFSSLSERCRTFFTFSGAPAGQLPRGHAANFKPSYIIRAKVGGDLLPGSWSPGSQGIVSNNGAAILVSDFQVREIFLRSRNVIINVYTFYRQIFVAKNVKWQAASNGISSLSAVFGGRTASRETVYVGRVANGEALLLGKIQASRGGLVVVDSGREIVFTSYEQLILA